LQAINTRQFVSLSCGFNEELKIKAVCSDEEDPSSVATAAMMMPREEATNLCSYIFLQQPF
jgi:hypothetical protein